MNADQQPDTKPGAYYVSVINGQRRALLRPVRLEVPKLTRRGRPGYQWVEGYAVTPPGGGELQPWMRKREALAFCRARRWNVTVTNEGRTP